MERKNAETNKKIEEPPVEGDGFMVNHVPSVFSRAEDYRRFDYFDPFLKKVVDPSTVLDSEMTSNKEATALGGSTGPV